MQRVIAGALSAVALWALVPAPAHADPGVPDFASYPKVNVNSYTVRGGLAYSVRGFRTPSGIDCTSSQHRDMYALNCTRWFAGQPGRAQSLSLSAMGPVVAAPKLTDSDLAQPTDVPKFEGTPLNLLPEGQLYAFDAVQCVSTGEILLACKMASRDTPDAKYAGFIATAAETTTFGNLSTAPVTPRAVPARVPGG